MKSHFQYIALGCALLCAGLVRAEDTPAKPPQTTNDYVVVLHGMGRTPVSMMRLAHVLKEGGYEVVNRWYWSLGKEPHNLVQRLAEIVREHCPDRSRRIHFVTHSLGGIITRLYLAEHPETKLGRVVMLGPPSQGSELTDAFRKYPIYERIMGKTGTGLGTGANDLARALPPVNFELGIVAGNKSINPLYSRLIPGPDDGKVSVERAKTEGMTDFIVLPATHTWMMQRDDVAQHALHFLKHGKFER